MIKFRVTVNKKLSQISNLGLSRNLKLGTLNCLRYTESFKMRALTFNTPNPLTGVRESRDLGTERE